jgi:hypothetical protein
MELRLTKLKSDFNNIITVRNNVKNVFDILQVRIDKLRQIYSEFINSNKNDMFVFGLDSFHFQSKLIDIEYDDMKRLFLAINNRMYCEYFKLHKIIVEYISKNINDKRSIDLVKINNYPVYKDLEPFKEYKFEIVLDIHENILNLLGVIISILNNKENELSIHKTKQNIGLNIDNFITTFNFNLSVMREKITMFIAYIEFFHKMHSKYIKRFSNKIQLMYTHINNDIKFDDSIEISKNKKRELIDEFISNHVDKELLKDLKTSIGSETNSEVSSGSKSSLNTPTIVNSDIDYIKLEDIKMSPLNMDNININSISSSPIYREKRDIKKIFKTNVHKVTNMLKLCKSKPEDIIDAKISNSDLQKIFSGINKSCDSIINDDDNNLTIKNIDDIPYLPIDFENYNEDFELINDKNDKYTIDKLSKTDDNVIINLPNNNNNNNNNTGDIIKNTNLESKSVNIQIDEIYPKDNKIIDNVSREIEKQIYANNKLLVDIIEEKVDIIEEKVDIIEEKVDIIEEKEDIIEEKEDIIEEKVDIIEEQEDIIEEKEDIIEEKEDVIDETVKLNDGHKKKKRTYNKKKK